jgi:hypothetical protein
MSTRSIDWLDRRLSKLQMEPRADFSRKARLGWDKCKLGESGSVEWNSGTALLSFSAVDPLNSPRLWDPNHFLHGKYSDSHGCQTD